jgi:ankyrin repeat protein
MQEIFCSASSKGHDMIQPNEMKATRPMKLHDGVIATTTDVWNMLSASQDGDLQRVKELAAKCPALLTCQCDYTCPLHFAVREGHLELVHYLVEQSGIDPDYKMHPFQESLLTLADDRGYEDIAAFLRQSSANPQLVRKWEDTGKIERGKDETERRFQEMVDQGNLDAVEALLQERPELARDEDMFGGEGILAMPAKDGNRAMMELLMRYGARVPDTSKRAKEYYFKNYESAVFLLENGMNPNHMNWRRVTLLHDLAFKGELRKVQLLLDYGAAINPIDEEFCSTPLGFAARWGRRDIVTLLIEHGADVNKASAAWAMPLAWARKKGHAEIATDLQQAGAL